MDLPGVSLGNKDSSTPINTQEKQEQIRKILAAYDNQVDRKKQA
jgi:hypothetical protein